MDPLTIGAVAAPIIGGLFGSSGQSKANRANLKIAREQMAFQERMRSTQYQTAIADMEAAGVNPALAITQGGAGNLPGAGATMGNVGAGVGAGVSDSITSAMAVRQMREALKFAKQQTREKSLQADFQKALNTAYGIQIRNGSVVIDRDMPNLVDKIQAELSSARALARLQEFKLPEAGALAEMWKNLGAGGKGVQNFLPMLIPLLMRMATQGAR